MFEELNHYLGWTNNLKKNGFMLLINEGTDNSFLIHHFLSSFVKQSLPVCLVTVAQTFSHYAQACAKIGANLDKAKAEGNVIHVDLMSSYLNHYLEMHSAQWNAKSIFLDLKQKLELMTQKYGSALLVIDDFSAVQMLNFQDRGASDLLHYLCHLSSSLSFLFVTAIPTLLHDKSKALQLLAMHHAEIILRTKSLPTGYSKEVHGQLELVKGGREKDIRQYKLTDKNLHLFAKGTSSAVL